MGLEECQESGNIKFKYLRWSIMFMATFVLVPGAWLGSWVWRKITPALEKKGNSVYPNADWNGRSRPS